MIGLLLAIAALVAAVAYLLSKVEALAGEVAKLLARFGPFKSWGQRRQTRWRLERRAQKLLRSLREEAPIATDKLAIEWVDPKASREALLEQGKVIVRLRSEDRAEQNLVHATMLFVSTSLLFRAKRYLDPEQRDSFDLFVTARMLGQTRDNDGVLDAFLSEYMYPRTAEEGSRVDEYVRAFEALAEAGLFYGVLLREVDYLGEKVWGKKFIAELPPEIDELLDMLGSLAARVPGEKINSNVLREYCRMGVVLVGMQDKMQQGIDTWIEYIQSALVRREVDSIYLLGMWRDRAKLRQIAAAFADGYELTNASRISQTLSDGKRDSFIAVMRRHDPVVFQPRLPSRRRPFTKDPATIRTGTSPATGLLGTVRRFGGLGFGFLEVDSEPEEAFFHLNDCINPPEFVARGDRVECDVRTEGPEEKLKAYNVHFLHLVETQQPRQELAARAAEEREEAGVAVRDPEPDTATEAESNGGNGQSHEPPEGRVSAEVAQFGTKGYGFLRIAEVPISVFFHLNDCLEPPLFIKRGETVTCEVYVNAPGQLRARKVEFALGDESDSAPPPHD